MAGQHSPDQGGGRPGPPKNGGGLGGWIKRNKGPAAAIGGLGAVALITIARRGSSSSPSSSSGTTSSQTGTQPGVYGYGSGDYSSGYDQYAGEMAGLQDLLNSYTAGTLGAQLFPNGLPQSAPTPAPASKPGNPGGYTVAPKPPIITRSLTPARTITVPKGATLASLSQKYLGTSNRTELAHANNLGTGAGLRAGQKLIIPAH